MFTIITNLQSIRLTTAEAKKMDSLFWFNNFPPDLTVSDDSDDDSADDELMDVDEVGFTNSNLKKSLK